MTEPKGPPGRETTVREALEVLLRQQPITARELSAEAHVSEKDVAEHLTHLAKSLKARGERLEVIPASCIACGFAFRTRERLSRPGACPKCRSTRIDPPQFVIRGR